MWSLRPDFYYCPTVACLLIWGALSDERTGLSFTIAAGLRQRSYFLVWVPWDWWPYSTLPDSRLPFSSSRTIRRATVEIVDPASTREEFILIWTASYVACRYPRKCLLITRIHGNLFLNELVSKNQSLRKRVCCLSTRFLVTGLHVTILISLSPTFLCILF
jgi:hypothetical protein